MIKRPAYVWALALVLEVTALPANSCVIVDKRPIRLGTGTGIEGRCANNGQIISCTLADDGAGIDCSGPFGEVLGDNMTQLVRAACGCITPQQDPDYLQQQLENYP